MVPSAEQASPYISNHMLCCAVLRCAALRCAVLCCAVLCCAVLMQAVCAWVFMKCVAVLAVDTMHELHEEQSAFKASRNFDGCLCASTA